MKTTVSRYDFHRAFTDYGREDQFSSEALDILFDYYEQFQDDTGEEVELDVIGLCCQFSEESWESIADNYSIDTSDCEDETEAMAAVESYLLDNTTLVGTTGTGEFVYDQF